MKKLLRIGKSLLIRISPSPEVAEHLESLMTETFVALVHKVGARRCLKQHKGSTNIKLNFGCGRAIKDGFVNLDFSPAADFRLDLRRNIPLPDSCSSLAYSEHFVEHLSYPEGAERFFSECFRILAPGGELSISVPGTEWPFSEYVNGGDLYLKACEQHSWHPSDCTTFIEHILTITSGSVGGIRAMPISRTIDLLGISKQ